MGWMQYYPEHLNKYRFRWLAVALAMFFIIPPFYDYPLLEDGKQLLTKILLISTGAQFFNPGRTRRIYLLIGISNILLGGSVVFSDVVASPLSIIEYISFVFLITALFGRLMLEIATMDSVTVDGIIGAFSGYILLGIIAFMTYLTISITHGEVFRNLGEGVGRLDQLFYYSFISLTTIGFGDIVPVHPYSQKLTIFFGIIGQFYIAVNVAILVSKYMQAKG